MFSKKSPRKRKYWQHKNEKKSTEKLRRKITALMQESLVELSCREMKVPSGSRYALLMAMCAIFSWPKT
jgi:hypothetical protein